MRRGSGGGFKNFILTVGMLVIVAGLVLGWARANNITSMDAGISYFRSWSNYFQDCGGDSKKLWWGGCFGSDTPNTSNSEKPSNGGDPGSKDNSNTGGNDSNAKNKALEQLDKLTIADPQSIQYSRSEWRHWVDPDGNGCDARQDVLARDGKEVLKNGCKVVSGKWIDPYSGITITDPSQIDIDHIIPLAAAARSGGQAWSPDKKQEYANDPVVLLAVSATENRSKSDKTASEYMPPNVSYQCTYAEKYVNVAAKYSLTISKADSTTLKAALLNCS